MSSRSGDLGRSGPAFLAPRAVNYVPLSPVSFLKRSAAAFSDKTAVVYGEQRLSYTELAIRAARLAGALAALGIVRGDVVAVLLPNVPPMLEAHYGVPALGAILNTINTRLDLATVRFVLGHGPAKLVIVDGAWLAIAREAMNGLDAPPRLIVWRDPADPGPAPLPGELDYETLLADAEQRPLEADIADEWAPLSLSYTSGTTGNPKGVLYHHRGAYLSALTNSLLVGLSRDGAYLWTLPMFHCNGWTFTWAVTAAGATHVCLRAISAPSVFELIGREHVTHLCGAPVVLNMLLNAPAGDIRKQDHKVLFVTGGAAPPSAVIEGMERRGFTVMHLYGLTESYGPATICEPQPHWPSLPLEEKARTMARQGINSPALEAMDVIDRDTQQPVPWDGATIGEIVLRGNTLMMGYHRNERATEEAFGHGWYWSGDLAVRHADGTAEIKDRAKDIIISGGENVSSLEVEEVLYRHPAVLEAAVVAMPHDHWGEVPCAFVTLKQGQAADEAALIAHVRAHLAGFKTPKRVVFGPLPKTSTGKVQKFELRGAARQLGAG